MITSHADTLIIAAQKQVVLVRKLRDEHQRKLSTTDTTAAWSAYAAALSHLSEMQASVIDALDLRA